MALDPVTNSNGQRGFYSQETGFVGIDAMEKVTDPTGAKGYYSSLTGFVPAPNLPKSVSPAVTNESRLQANTPEWATTQGRFGEWGPNLYGALGAAKEVARTGTEMAGMVAGGIAGAPLGPVGIGAGAVGGYGLVKSIERMMEGETPTAETLTSDLTTGTLFQGVPPAIIRGVVKVAAPYGKRFTEHVSNLLTKDTDAYLKAVRETGYEPTIAETHGVLSRTFAQIESILNYVPGASSVINRAKIGNLEKLMKYRNDLIGEGAEESIIEKVGFRIKRDAEEILTKALAGRKDFTKAQLDAVTNSLLTDLHANTSRSVRTSELSQTAKEFFDASGMAPKPSEMGKTVQDVMAQVKTSRYKQAGELLERAKKDLGGYELDTPITKGIADQLLSEEMKSSFPNPNVLRSLRAFSSKELNPEIQAIVDQWVKNPELKRKNQEVIDSLLSEYGASTKKTWQGLDLDVSKLTENARKANDLQGTSYAGSRGSMTREGRVYSALAGGLKDDMATFAKATNPKAFQNFSEGKDLWRLTEELFDRDTLKIMRLAPEDVVKTIGKGEVDNVIRLKEILGEKDFQPFEKALVSKIVAFDKEGVLDIARTKVNMNQYGETVKAVLSPQNQKLLTGLVDNASKIEQSFSRTKSLSDTLVYDSNGTIRLDATKKNLLKNRENLNQYYTPEEVAKIDAVLPQIEKINLKSVARNKQEAVEFIGSIVGSDNAGIVKAIVKPNNTVNVNFMKRILGPERTAEVKQEFIKEYLLKVNAHGYYSPETANSIFTKYKSTMKSLMDPGEYHELSNLMELNKRAATLTKLASNPSQTGQTLIGYEMGKRILGSLTNAIIGGVSVGYATESPYAGLAAAGISVVAPYAVAKLYLSKQGRQWLTLGYTIPAKSQEAAQILMRLSGIAGVNLSGGEE